MTRQEMLNKIYEKINFPYDDGDAVYSPVKIGDVLDFGEKEIKDFYKPEKDRVLTGYNHLSQPIYETISVGPSIFDFIIEKWKTKRKPLDKQSDDCVSYIYSLI